MLDQLIESKRDHNPILSPRTLVIAIGLHAALISGLYARYHGQAPPAPMPASASSTQPAGGAARENQASATDVEAQAVR